MSTPSREDAFDGEALFENDGDRRLEGAFLAGAAIGRLKRLLVIGADRSALAGPIDLFSIIVSDFGWSSETHHADAQVRRRQRCGGIEPGAGTDVTERTGSRAKRLVIVLGAKGEWRPVTPGFYGSDH
jgi:hypothetical protein